MYYSIMCKIIYERKIRKWINKAPLCFLVFIFVSSVSQDFNKIVTLEHPYLLVKTIKLRLSYLLLGESA